MDDPNVLYTRVSSMASCEREGCLKPDTQPGLDSELEIYKHPLVPITLKEWSVRELQLLALCIEFEGSISIIHYKGRNVPALRIAIHQKDKRILDRFVDTIGLGRVTGPYYMYNKTMGREQTRYTWHLTTSLGQNRPRKNKLALQLYWAIEPYLVTKKVKENCLLKLS